MARRKKLVGEAAERTREEDGLGQSGLEHDEIVAIVCKYFCDGVAPADIAARMRQEHGIEMTREGPYKYIRYAASKRWVRFVPPNVGHLADQLRERFDYLRRVEVVHTPVIADVSRRAADVLVKILRDAGRGARPKSELHIGFAGGEVMRQVAAHLAESLSRASGPFPDRLVLHALVAGFDLNIPITDPNAFFTYFVRSDLPLKVGYVGLHAPAIVRPNDWALFTGLPGIKAAFAAAKQLDVIVTSAAVLTDRHSMLARYYVKQDAEARRALSPDEVSEAETIRDMLAKDECVGDMLWLPLSKRGPIDTNRYPYRSMTVVELSDLETVIRNEGRVLLTLGPCTSCHELKTEILETILNMEKRLISDLVVDSRTVRQLLKTDEPIELGE
jgi:DNA-binding transcriptional regulator LsrR (DeoR family)